MSALIASSANLWKNLTLAQKSYVIVGAVALALAAAVIIPIASAPHYVQLYGNLTEGDASQVVDKLKELKVTYRLGGGGHSIEVPAERADELRLSLAGEGLPRGGNVGFELFDKTQIGQSEFGEHLNYVRALQGELSRTIEQINAIRAARVHLALPERTLYSVEDKQPSASVVLNLAAANPTPREIKSVVHLVASAVEGLKPENVTVVDTNGNLLSEVSELGADAGGTDRMQAQRQAASQIEERVQSMLDRVLGPQKAIVRATVRMNFDRIQRAQERYTPVAEGTQHGIIEQEHHVIESYGNGKKPLTTGGPVGTASNTTPAALTTTATGTNKDYSREETTTQYRVSHETEQVEVAAGQVENISLAVFVDKSVKMDQIADLEKTIAAAAGIDSSRNDQIVVQQLAFDTSAQKAEEKAMKDAQRSSMIATIGKYAGAGLLVVIFLFILLRIYRSTLAPANLPHEQALDVYATLPHLDTLDEEFSALPAEQANERVPELALAMEENAINDLDPERIARVIKEMMEETTPSEQSQPLNV